METSDVVTTGLPVRLQRQCSRMVAAAPSRKRATTARHWSDLGRHLIACDSSTQIRSSHVIQD
eukprot:6196887-Pleurochrysis_carterae.AAC.1